MGAIAAAFRNSMCGLKKAAREERAVRQELMLLAASIPLAFLIASTLWQGALLIASLLIVLSVEILNTAIEKFCDHVTPERHPAIGYIKDLGSAAVFFSLLLAGLLWSIAVIEMVRRVL